nr:cobalamin-dependent protein [Rhizobium lemnae]
MSELTLHAGVTKLVVHAWERRYGLKPQTRTGSKRRLYTFEQAERFRLLKKGSDAGYRIGSLIGYSLDDLYRLERELDVQAGLAIGFDLLTSKKLEELEVWLIQLSEQQSLDSFILHSVPYLMQNLGKLWVGQQISIADEHFVTACVKRILLGKLHMMSPAPRVAPWIVATTPEGDSHELGALCAAILARRNGWNVLYLGPNLPASEVARLSNRYSARYICLSTSSFSPKRLSSYLLSLEECTGPDTMMIVGGASTSTLASSERRIVLNALEDMIQYLVFD